MQRKCLLYVLAMMTALGMKGMPARAAEIAETEIVTSVEISEDITEKTEIVANQIGVSRAYFAIKIPMDLVTREMLTENYATVLCLERTDKTGAYTDYNEFPIQHDDTIEEVDGFYTMNLKASYLLADTTYDVKLVYKSGEQTIDLTKTIQITTEENVTYTEEDIPDERLREALKEALERTGGILDKAHFEDVYYLELSRDKVGGRIKNLKGIELFENLGVIEINDQKVRDISILAQCKKIGRITANNNRIETIPDLSGLEQLVDLELKNNRIPEEEFSSSNTNIPEYLRTESWLNYTKNNQKRLNFVLTDSYYVNQDDRYDMQVAVENGNHYDCDYTMSVYDGTGLVVDHQPVEIPRGSEIGFYFEGIVPKAGKYTFTFVLYDDNEEVARTTEEIEFKEERVYLPEIQKEYDTVNKVSFTAYVYNTKQTITTARLVGADGTVIAEQTVPSKNCNKVYKDYRYVGAFSNNYGIYQESINVFTVFTLTDRPQGGEYHVDYVLADGTIYQSQTALIIEKDFPFVDVDLSSWMYSGIDYVYQRNIMTGKSGTRFDPNGAMTRAEFVTTLYSMQGKPGVSYEEKFTDVVDGQWYTKPIMWAYQNKVVSGYANGAFGTSDRITREQLALMIYKYAKDTCGMKVTVDKDALERFDDKDKVSDWSREALQWAVTNGVMSGKGNALDPVGNATRAECAAMLKKLMEQMAN